MDLYDHWWLLSVTYQLEALAFKYVFQLLSLQYFEIFYANRMCK